MRLKGKTALVTGGGSGIGAAVARVYSAEGCDVMIAGRRQDRLDQVVRSAPGPGRILAEAADIAVRDQAAALVCRAVERLGRIDILVNNAGINIRDRRMETLSVENWEYLMQVNASGPFYVIHAALPAMRQRKDGLIISISSTAGCRASELAGAAYCASKHAMSAMTKTISLEDRENGIRATVISPGEVNTAILDDRPIPVTEEHRQRILQPEDVAAAALFVACLPPRANVPELVIKPTIQAFD